MQKHQLFLVHFAGGSSQSYNFLTPFLSNYHLTPLELPGRGSRAGEDLISDYNDAADDIFRQLRNKLVNSASFSIYGHSMGALLGLKVSELLIDTGLYPQYLFVSGNPGPLMSRRSNISALSRQDFFDRLRILGGTPTHILDHQDFMEFYEPILRADFKVSEEVDIRRFSKAISTPIHAIMGDLESEAEHISNWKNFTNASFTSTILPGAHFFIKEHTEQIAAIISFKLEGSSKASM